MQSYTPSAAAVAVNGYYNMQPSAGIDFIVHNVITSGAATLERYDSVNDIAIIVAASTMAMAWMALQLHCSNTVYYRVKNTGGSSINVCADGVIPT